MEILINYILPNAVMFGGLCLAAKGIEAASWYVICNHDVIIAKLQGN